MTSPVVTAVPEFAARFDPRTGTTGNWRGADSARSVPLGDDDNRTVWLFADTWWADADTTPGSRNGAYITSDSIAIQTGPYLDKATVTFHQGRTANLRWFPISTTHYSWPMDGLVIGNDLYVLSMRVLQSSPLGGEYGWAVHRIPNAKTTPVTSWAAILLYQSEDTGTRPVFSPYDGGDGYIYAFAVKRPTGWLRARWALSDFTGNGTQVAVQWWTGTAWSSDVAQATVISDSPNTSEGSVHRRRTDARWMITDNVDLFPLMKGAVRVTQSLDEAGRYAASGSGGYQPPPPPFQPGDHVKDEGNFDAVIQSINPDGSRVIKYYSIWGGNTATKALANLTLKNQSDRAVHVNPRFSQTPLPADYSTYAYKAHPQIPGGGLVLTYVDNAAGAPDLSIYWPKFVRIAPPTLTGLAVTSGGLVTWTVDGAPDRILVRHNYGTWVDAGYAATSYQLTGYTAGQPVEVIARGVGGDTWRAVGGTKRQSAVSGSLVPARVVFA